MSFHKANMRDRQLLRLVSSITAAWLILALTAPIASGQIEETRLTQPTLDPIPPAPSEDEEEPRPEPPADRANILGMTVIESDAHRALVTDVAMMSPAEEAGIREGDEVVSFAGFRGKDYEEWLQGVRRIVRDTPDGSMLPMVVVRNGEEGVVQIRTLVSRADPQPLARPPRFIEPPGPGLAPTAPQPGVAIDEQRFFGQAFVNGAVARPTDRAIAYLHLLGAHQAAPMRHEELGDAAQPVQSDRRTAERLDAQDPVAPSNSRGPREPAVDNFNFNQTEQHHPGPHIGLAGFQSQPQGLLVTVDVGALQPGNYLVAIVDPGAVTGGFGNFGIEADAVPGVEPAEPQPQSPRNGRIQPSERNFQPLEGQRSGRLDRPEQEQFEQPLRQQVDEGVPADDAGRDTTAQATGEVNQLSAPATGEVNQLSAPATGEVNPLSATPTGQADPRATQPDAGTDARSARPQPAGFDELVSAGLGAPVGMLTVDQSGTGQMQQIVEGVQVADVVGQAIVIYTQAGQQPAVPPGGEVTDAAQPRQAREAQPERATPDIPHTTAPVAAGVIQYLSARGMPGATEATGLPDSALLQEETRGQAPQEPAAEQPPVEQQLEPERQPAGEQRLTPDN